MDHKLSSFAAVYLDNKYAASIINAVYSEITWAAVMIVHAILPDTFNTLIIISRSPPRPPNTFPSLALLLTSPF